MRVLGIGYGVHDTGAALIDDGSIVEAINEERLTRVKRESRFPASSINHVLSEHPGRIDEIAIAGGGFGSPYIIRNVRRTLKQSSLNLSALDDLAKSVYNGLTQPKRELNNVKSEIQETTQISSDLVTLNERTEYIEHDLAHAASAYYPSGLSEATILVCDAAGDNTSSSIYHGKKGDLNLIEQNDDVDSIGKLWAQLPTVFGFKGPRHAGKFMGLAPYAESIPTELQSKIERIIDVNGTNIINRFEREHGNTSYENQVRELKSRLGECDAAKVAHALQKRTEDILVKFAQAAIKKTGNTNVAVSGGVFANVKVNQRIYEINKVDKFYVHQNMGDGGLGLGAALHRFAALDGSFQPFKLETVSLGPSYDQAAINRALDSVNIPESYSTRTYDDTDDFSKRVAVDLANGCAVCLFTGSMEYGPRALGNRSILYQPTDPSAIEWLNQRLDRTEFMPFAPVTLAEDAVDCYKGYDPENCPAAEFMTLTFDCTTTMKERSPGTVHVDGTARPQIIYEEQNPLYHNIISSYKDITGIPTLINTSFNRHGEPIVSKPAEAIRSFMNSDIETLVLENTVVHNESAESSESNTKAPVSAGSE